MKYTDSSDSFTSGGDMSLELLPDLTLEEIFSFLPVRDLKNVRLVSTRMSKAVLDNDNRFKTWTIDVSRDLPQETDKVFEYNLNIEVEICGPKKDDEELFSWLIKHSSCISGISVVDTRFSEKEADSLSQLKQVRKLELLCNKDTLKTLLSSLAPQLESLTLKGDREDSLRLNETDLSGINLPCLKQLELFKGNDITVKTLLSSLAPQLESLTLRNIGILNQTDFSSISLTSLKHLKLNSCNREMIFSILKLVPVTIESLELEVPFRTIESLDTDPENIAEILSAKKQLNYLKYLSIRNYFYIELKLPANVLCKSLTRLSLENVDLVDIELEDTNLPSLNIMQLERCNIKMGLFKNLLKKSAQSLHKLTLNQAFIIDVEDLDCSLPALTKLEIIGMRNINWLSELLSACSRSLTTLNFKFVDSCRLDELTYDLPALTKVDLSHITNVNGIPQLLSACSRSLTFLKLSFLQSCSLDKLENLTCDLPAMKVMTISNCGVDMNHLLRKCASSLQILYLYRVGVKFEVHVPNLKELHLRDAKFDGFTNLVSSQESSLEIIGLGLVSGPILDEIVSCTFTNLKEVYMYNMTDMDPDKINKLNTSIITPHAEVNTDDDEWKKHLKYKHDIIIE